jgi:hypothetical protein
MTPAQVAEARRLPLEAVVIISYFGPGRPSCGFDGPRVDFGVFSIGVILAAPQFCRITASDSGQAWVWSHLDQNWRTMFGR